MFYKALITTSITYLRIFFPHSVLILCFLAKKEEKKKEESESEDDDMGFGLFD